MASSTSTPDQELVSNVEDDDVWADQSSPTHADAVPSDLPTVRRHHMTDGYREGLSIGKQKVMQEAFDNGYPIGIAVGLRAGNVLGILEGYLACNSIHVIPGMRQLVKTTHNHAVHELNSKKLLENLDEKVLHTHEKIPDSIEHVLSRWEGIVTGVYESREQTKQILYETNGQNLQDMVVEAKLENGRSMKKSSDALLEDTEKTAAKNPLAGSEVKKAPFW